MQKDNELISAYVEDTTAFINEMDQILKKRNSIGSLDEESVNALFRIFHTIKASALIVEDSKTVDISYKMENIMSYLKKHGCDALPAHEVIDLMFNSEYFFRSRLGIMMRSSTDHKVNEFEDKLDDMVNSIDFEEMPFAHHMVSFESYRPMFENIVNQMSEELGKMASIQFEGEKLYLDRQIMSKLSGPLVQIVRNAMDHGIETPEERLKKGKPEAGIITFTYGIEDGIMFITVFNDGEKINLKNILRRADHLNLLKKPRDNYKPNEIAALIMERGFSSKDKPNKFSGRGVGMDVIKSTARDMGGTVLINSGSKDGFSITITFPIDEKSQKSAIKEQTRGGSINESQNNDS